MSDVRMQKLVHALSQTFGPQQSFALFVFPKDAADASRCNYYSNGEDRTRVLTVVREMIADLDWRV